MTDSGIKLCATDKEVFDVLMSGKRRFAEPTLLALARDRGVFYSAGESREKLASNLSLLPFGYNELAALLQNAQGARAEKVTHVTLGIELSIDQIKSVVSQYTSQAPSDERVVHHQSGEKNVTVDVQYSEIDYSKTRLVQRREREAEIEFIVEDGQTTIRMPANEKAKEITASFKAILDTQLRTSVTETAIELTEFVDAGQRTEFFNLLVSQLPGFRLLDVMNVKVDSMLNDDSDGTVEVIDDEDDGFDSESVAMLGVVKDVALRGVGLLTSPVYQELRQKGFFITSITWRSEQLTEPFSAVEFDAGFNDPVFATGFKYNVRGVAPVRNIRGTSQVRSEKFQKTYRAASSEDRESWFKLIETSARKIVSDLRSGA